MQKDQAERALQIIRDTIQNTREDLAEQNWGATWMCHAFSNAAGFAAVGYFVEREQRPILAYLVPLSIVAVVNLVIIAALIDRDRGVRSFVERQIHGIWMSFTVFGAVGVLVIELGDLPPASYGPILALTSGFAFAVMGVVFSVRFLATAVAFVVLALVSPAFVEVQWYLVATLWWVALMVPGITLHREKRRRRADDGRTEIA